MELVPLSAALATAALIEQLIGWLIAGAAMAWWLGRSETQAGLIGQQARAGRCRVAVALARQHNPRFKPSSGPDHAGSRTAAFAPGRNRRAPQGNPRLHAGRRRDGGAGKPRKQLATETQELQNLRNTRSKAIGQAKAKGEDVAALMAEVAGIGDKLKANEQALAEAQAKFPTSHC